MSIVCDLNFTELLHKAVPEIMEDVIELRRHLHMHPETGFDTQNTEQFIRDTLKAEGIEVLPSEVGVLALIQGQDHSRITALRADIDALKLKEERDVPYKSVYEGKMHACGHDGHTAMVLGAAKILQKYRDQLDTDVLLVFQPAEEGPGLGGAIQMIPQMKNCGVYDKIIAMFGQHVSNDYPSGCVGIKKGSVSASTDSFHITFKGLGGHAGTPEKCIDALSTGVKFVTAMESFMARRMDPFDQAVCSIGIFNAGTAMSVVSETAYLAGTVRCQKEATRGYILENLERIAKGVAYTAGAECDLKIARGIPGLVNDDDAVAYAKSVLKETLGSEAEVEIERPMMGAEDFSYYAREFKSAFLWLGTRNEEKECTAGLHNARFDFDEDAMANGIKMLCNLTYNVRNMENGRK